MRRLQLAKIIVVAVVLLIPSVSLMVLGLGEGFENRARTKMPSVADLLEPDPAARVAFAKALFEGAAVKREAINVVSRTQLQLTEQIETTTVISGEEGWLFFKPSLDQWHCAAHPGLKPRLERLEFIFDLVTAAEVPFVFAVAPNKASIERDKFGGRATLYKRCYEVIQGEFEALTSAASPRHVVDHTVPLRALVDAGHSAYLMWDTHWTQAAGFDAMNQLFEARPGEIGLPHESPDMAAGDQLADLAVMLAVDASRLPQVEIPQPLPVEASQMSAVRPLLLHDSFYERIMPYLVARAPSASFEQMRQHRLEISRDSLEQASLVVFSAVQRNYLKYVWSPEVLGWGGTVGNWLLDSSTAAAQRCAWGEGARIKTRRDPRSAGARVFAIPKKFKAGTFCLRIATILAHPMKATLHISSSEWGMPEFSTGRMLEKQLRQGTDTLGLMLPRSYALEQYRFTLGNRGSGASNVVIEVARAE